MKKLIGILLVLAMLLSCAAMAENALLGGWSVRESEALPLPEEAAAAFEKAMEGFVGSNVTPVALLATQVVSGTNYCILCSVTPVVPNAESHYALVYIYADLNGGAELKGFVDLEYGAAEPETEPEEAGAPAIMGGWTVYENEPAALAEDADKALSAALEKLVGADYAPVALLATQVVSGTNYCILCRVTPVAPNAESRCALVYVYADLNGGAALTDVADIAFSLPEIGE